MSTIGHDLYPHIFDSILSYAPYESLVVLRTASRALRERADTLLVSHIAVTLPNDPLEDAASWDRHLWTVQEGVLRGIPRRAWFKTFADNVEIIDMHCTGEVHASAIAAARLTIMQADEAAINHAAPGEYPGLPTTLWNGTVVPQTDRCWCGQTRGFDRELLAFAQQFRFLRLLRRFGSHECPGYFNALRTVSFQVATPKWAKPSFVPFAMHDHGTPEHVLHVGYEHGGDELLSARLMDYPASVERTDLLPYRFFERVSHLIVRVARCTEEPLLDSGAELESDTWWEGMFGDVIEAPESSRRWYRRQRRYPSTAGFSNLLSSCLDGGHKLTFVLPDDWFDTQPYTDWSSVYEQSDGMPGGRIVDYLRREWHSFARSDDSQKLFMARIDQLFTAVSEEEYRASVGAEIYELEAYSRPQGWEEAATLAEARRAKAERKTKARVREARELERFRGRMWDEDDPMFKKCFQFYLAELDKLELGSSTAPIQVLDNSSDDE